MYVKMNVRNIPETVVIEIVEDGCSELDDAGKSCFIVMYHH